MPESTLEERMRVLESVLDSMGEGVVVVDRDGRFLEFNEAAERIIGIGKLDVPPSEWPAAYGLFLPDGRTPYPADQLPLARAMRGEAVDEAEIRIRSREQAEGKWISVNARPVRNQQGLLEGGVVIIRDITAAQETLHLLEHLFTAVEQTDDTVFITDIEGRIQYVNPAFERTTQFAREEVQGRTPRVLKSGMHDAAYYKSLWEKIRAGETHRGTAINRKKNGEIYYAEQTITPIKDNTGQITNFVSVVKDMTERRKLMTQEIEMNLACKVQAKLYPQRPPEVKDLDLAGAIFSAEVTCGDYFDFIDRTQGRLCLAIGDVSGHGLPSALVMVETRALLRAQVQETKSLGRIFGDTNRVLFEDLEDNRYATLLAVEVDAAHRCLWYCNAGHIPGYVLSGSGTVKAVLKPSGPPLGMWPESLYETSGRIGLEPEDLIVLLTDGVTETSDRDDRHFGADRVLKVIGEHRREPAQEILLAVREATRTFAGSQHQEDDMAIILCRMKP